MSKRTFASIEELIEFRRSKETIEERTERHRKQAERLARVDKECHAKFQASIPTQALLDKVISL